VVISYCKQCKMSMKDRREKVNVMKLEGNRTIIAGFHFPRESVYLCVSIAFTQSAYV
jgi:hypothetical protein